MDKLLNKSWIVYGDSSMQMFHWLCPFIEAAGYKWTIEPLQDTLGGWRIETTYEG